MAARTTPLIHCYREVDVRQRLFEHIALMHRDTLEADRSRRGRCASTSSGKKPRFGTRSGW